MGILHLNTPSLHAGAADPVIDVPTAGRLLLRYRLAQRLPHLSPPRECSCSRVTRGLMRYYYDGHVNWKSNGFSRRNVNSRNFHRNSSALQFKRRRPTISDFKRGSLRFSDLITACREETRRDARGVRPICRQLHPVLHPVPAIRPWETICVASKRAEQTSTEIETADPAR